MEKGGSKRENAVREIPRSHYLAYTVHRPLGSSDIDGSHPCVSRNDRSDSATTSAVVSDDELLNRTLRARRELTKENAR